MSRSQDDLILNDSKKPFNCLKSPLQFFEKSIIEGSCSLVMFSDLICDLSLMIFYTICLLITIPYTEIGRHLSLISSGTGIEHSSS